MIDSMASNNLIKQRRLDQAGRQKHFPPDRIALAYWPQTVASDMTAMRRYREGDITFDTLRLLVARNNYLDEYYEDNMIPETAMRNLLRFTGWERPNVNTGI